MTGAPTPAPAAFPPAPVLHVVLVEPEIPPNTGNVARLCAATRCRLHLVEPLGFRVEDRYLRRAGLDYWEHVDVRTWKSLDALLETEPAGRFFLYSSRVHRPYTRAAHSPGDWLLFGCETRGLPEPLLARFADRTYTIPMWGPVRSLNLSTSVGIVVYEALRQIHGF
ncbi:MAG: tRNA (cytidine(34)-2'-O)-methyltransferase [Acidobacteria bacterium]|nr:tRNA (cytidine(34)-2'-O)-methyltransferase [Acidobacteriota bacterium]